MNSRGKKTVRKKYHTKNMSFLLLCTLLVYYSVLVMVIGLVLEKYRSKCQYHLLISLLPWKLLSCVQLFVTPWTVAWQAPLSMGIFQARILEWGFPNPGIEPRSPAFQVDSFHLSHQVSPRILEWVAYSFSRGYSWPRNWIRVSCIAGRFFTSWATREALWLAYQCYLKCKDKRLDVHSMLIMVILRCVWSQIFLIFFFFLRCIF